MEYLRRKKKKKWNGIVWKKKKKKKKTFQFLINGFSNFNNIVFLSGDICQIICVFII